MSDMRRLIETVDSSSSKTKVDEALPLVGAGLAAGARLAAPYVARAGSAIMRGIRGAPKTPEAPPVVTPSGVQPTIPPNVNVPAVVRNRPGEPLPGSAPAVAKPPAGAPATPTTAPTAPSAPSAKPTVAKPRIERRPGETPADAIKRAQAEKGTTTAKPAEPAAPTTPPGEGPAVWRNPRTGEVSSTPPGGGAASRPPTKEVPPFKDTTGPERAAMGRDRYDWKPEPLIPKPLPGKPGSVLRQRRKLIPPGEIPGENLPRGGGGGGGGASGNAGSGGAPGSTSSDTSKDIDWDKDVIWVSPPSSGGSGNGTTTAEPAPPKQEPPKQEPSAPTAPRPEPAKQEPAPAPPKPEPVRQQPPAPTPAKQEPAKQEPAKQEPAASGPGAGSGTGSGTGPGTGTGSGTGAGSGTGSGKGKGEGPLDRFDLMIQQGIPGYKNEDRSTKKLMKEFSRHLSRI